MNNPGEPIKPFIHYDQYERLVDVIMFIGTNTVLKFNTVLAKYTENGRQFFHKEFEYYSKAANSSVVTIKREFEFYLSIENLKMNDDGVRESIRIGIDEIMMLRQALAKVALWFTNKEYTDLYAIHNSQLIITRKVDNITIPYLPFGKYLEFEPIIFTYKEESSPGVRMYLSSNSNFVDISLNKFMGFKYTIDTFNLYQSAQNMLAYMGRPENGYNLSSYVESPSERRHTNGVDHMSGGQTGRQIPYTLRQANLKDKIGDDK